MAIMTLSDLRPRFGPARFQGSRPTCIAFAISDTHAATRGTLKPLSVEHLYYHAVQRTPGRDPNSGVNMPTSLQALEKDGQCLEEGWPYVDPLDLAAWSPPATATPTFRRASTGLMLGVNEIIGELDANRPVVVALRISERFFDPDPEGRITPAPNDPDVDYHAVVAVGHGAEGSNSYILVRNSWGNDWGMSGHAWVETKYLNPRLYALALLVTQEIV